MTADGKIQITEGQDWKYENGKNVIEEVDEAGNVIYLVAMSETLKRKKKQNLMDRQILISLRQQHQRKQQLLRKKQHRRKQRLLREETTPEETTVSEEETTVSEEETTYLHQMMKNQHQKLPLQPPIQQQLPETTVSETADNNAFI